MTPKRIDVSILCARCQRPVDHREMIHDAPGGVYRYFVSCHGEKDFGDHLIVTADDSAHGKELTAFPQYKTDPGAMPRMPSVALPMAQPTSLPPGMTEGRGTDKGGASPGP